MALLVSEHYVSVLDTKLTSGPFSPQVTFVLSTRSCHNLRVRSAEFWFSDRLYLYFITFF
jgi:hypothetical protein